MVFILLLTLTFNAAQNKRFFMNVNELVVLLIQELEEQKANEIVSLFVSNLTSLTDYILISSGRSNRHVQAIAKNLIGKMKKKGILPLGYTGLTQGEWVLIDFDAVIIHVMCPEVRVFYDLEGLWKT